MPTVFLLSDSHFGHENILKFRHADGSLMRDFDSVHTMHDYMITMWNETIRPGDHVYHLGDFAIPRQWVEIAKWLHGKKRLVRGNHDIHETKRYIDAGFKEIYGVRVLHDCILSHIPLHPTSLRHNWLNIHGHIHSNESRMPWPTNNGDRYYNVSVEVIGYKPRSLEQIRAEVGRA